MLNLRGQFACILASAFLAAIPAARKAAGGEPGESVHADVQAGPYMLAPAPDGVTVCWLSEKECVGRVRWQAERAPSWLEARETQAARFHAIRIKGLSPDAEHRIEAFSGDAPAGALAYRSPPGPGAETAAGMSFFVYGDSQARPTEHALIAGGLLAEAQRLQQFTFVLHLGDFASKATSSEAEWIRQFFGPAGDLLRRLPILPVRGNHEGDGEMYRRFFPEPSPPPELPGGCDYRFDYGPARFLVLDRYAPGGTREARLKWAGEALAAPGARWRFGAVHPPPYSNGAHGSDLDYRGCIEPTLVAGRVHAVFSGHEHNYQRTRPTYGITYLVSGGAGGSLGGPRRKTPEWLLRFEKTRHFLTVTVTADKAVVRALRPVGGQGPAFEEFDSFEIPADCGWPPAGSIVGSGDGFVRWPGIAAMVAAIGMTAVLVVLVVRRAVRRRPTIRDSSRKAQAVSASQPLDPSSHL